MAGSGDHGPIMGPGPRQRPPGRTWEEIHGAYERLSAEIARQAGRLNRVEIDGDENGTRRGAWREFWSLVNMRHALGWVLGHEESL